MTEEARRHLEDEIRRLNRERGELVEKYNQTLYQKNALTEEAMSLRDENSRQGDTVVRLAKEKEDLMKDKAELVVQVTALERECRQLSEVV